MSRNQMARALSAGLLLIVAAPLLVVCAFAILFEDGWPVLFTQTRVGKYGVPFRLIKLRTMRNCASGSLITANNDSRGTRAGRILRRYKLDELPQLLNVMCGEMNFIGPRPEVPCYVDLSDSRWREVLSVAPGLVDLASLTFRNEEALLSDQSDIDEYYRSILLPRKLLLSAHYLRHRNITWDLRLIGLTLFHVFASHRNLTPVARSFDYEES